MRSDAGYWQAGIPREGEVLAERLADGGTWGQPFWYKDLAHLLIPREFFREGVIDGRWEGEPVSQDVELVAARLESNHLPFRLGDYALEVKCY